MDSGGRAIGPKKEKEKGNPKKEKESDSVFNFPFSVFRSTPHAVPEETDSEFRFPFSADN